MPTWAASEWKALYEEKFGADFFNHQSDTSYWEKIYEVPDKDIWALRTTMKNKFIDFVRRDFKEKWLKNAGDPTQVMSITEKINPNALIIGFARRFATYKRAHLLFSNLDRLAAIVNNPDRPVQFVFSGKAHPADGAGQGLIKRIVEISRMPQFLGKIIFLENYDMVVAKRLVSGVDIWLNTPTRPLEASGTSGEKAEMNGVLNFSVLDGWWYEGYKFCEQGGWALTDKNTFTDTAQQDKLDAEVIYTMLENQIIPLYFENRKGGFSAEWVKYIKNSVAKIAPHFTMKRMIDDYIDRFYSKEARRYDKLSANNYAVAREIVAWKERVAQAWPGVHAVEVNTLTNEASAIKTGYNFTTQIKLETNGIGHDLGVECVLYKLEDGEDKYVGREQFKLVAEEGNFFTFELKTKLREAGSFRYAYRVYPSNDKLPNRQDFAYVLWV
jgi:starch phosphorylase